MDYPVVLRELVTFCEEREAPFAVVGGFALQAYGISRATFDLDIVTTAAVQEELVGYLESAGYETLHRSSGFSNHVHPSVERGRIDVVYVSGPTADRLFEAAVPREIFPNLELPVPKAEHLIAMKVHAMKNDPDRELQEMSDIRALILAAGADPEAVRGYFEDAGLGDRFDEIVRRL